MLRSSSSHEGCSAEGPAEWKRQLDEWLQWAQRQHALEMQELKHRLLLDWSDLLNGISNSKLMDDLPSDDEVVSYPTSLHAQILPSQPSHLQQQQEQLVSVNAVEQRPGMSTARSFLSDGVALRSESSKGSFYRKANLGFKKHRGRSLASMESPGSKKEIDTSGRLSTNIAASVVEECQHAKENVRSLFDLQDRYVDDTVVEYGTTVHDKLKSSRVARCVASGGTNRIAMFLALLNAFLTVTESNCRISRTLSQRNPWESACDTRVFFYGELVLWVVAFVGDSICILVFGRLMITLEDIRWWFLFGCLCEFISLFYFVWDIAPNLTCLRVLCELAHLKYLYSPWAIRVAQKVSAMISAFWLSIPIWMSTTVSLALIVCLSSIVLTYFINIGLQSGNLSYALSQDEVDDFVGYFGTFGKTVLTLFVLVSGGSDWYDVMNLMSKAKLGVRVQIIFLCYIILMFLGVLNLVTSLFVEQVIEANAGTLSANVRQEEESIARLQQIFRDTDTDKSGTISWTEFEDNLGDRRVGAYLASLDSNVNELRVCFEILDTDGTGNVTIDDFVWGCMRLKGSAKSIDLCTLLYEYRQGMRATEGFLSDLAQKLNQLDSSVTTNSKLDRKSWFSRSHGNACEPQALC